MSPPQWHLHCDGDILPATKPGVIVTRFVPPMEQIAQVEVLFYRIRFLKGQKMNDYFLLRFTHRIAPNPAQTEVSTVKKETGEYVVFFTGVTGVARISLVRGMVVVT